MRHITPRRAVLFLITVALALLPGAALAQDPDAEGGLLLRVNGDVRLPAGESSDTIIVINGDAVVDGSVTGALVVVNGDATVNGRVDEEVVVINGTVTLGETARVGGDVALVRSDLTRAPGAVVEGTVEERSEFGFGRAGAVFSFLVWLGFTLVVLLAGLLFAAVAGRQLTRAATLLTSSVGGTLLGAVLVWVGIPILAVLAFVTLVGIPLGLALLLFLLPALWFLGYLVAGTRLGGWLLDLMHRPTTAAHPYLAALLGLLVLQLVLWIPFLGGLIWVLAGMLGAGTLALLAWRAWQGRGMTTPGPEARRVSPSGPAGGW
jgi:hypothetical protein